MYPNYPNLIRSEWRTLALITIVVFLISLIATMVQPFEYQATVSILVMQKSSFSIDAYSASKSEERIAQKLSQVVYSSTFFNQVMNSSYNIDQSYFPEDEQKSRKKWNKTVETSVPSGFSTLNIAVYNTDPNQALQMSQAVSYVLTANQSDYLGIGDVELRILNAPLVSKYPVRPHIILNIVLGLVGGFILGIVYIILSYNPKRDSFNFPQTHIDNGGEIR